MTLLLIDNYDSFTFNLVHGVGQIDPSLPVHVTRNDRITVMEAEALSPTHLVLSPGPRTPRHTGICGDLVERFRGRIPILGVCLGHQVIAERHGMSVTRHHRLMHGKTSVIHHDGRGIFRGIPSPFTAARYHSLIVGPAAAPPDFEISAWTGDGEVMALRWTAASRTPPYGGGAWRTGEEQAPMDGVQFHPESFLTPDGPRVLANFLAQRATHAPSPSLPLSSAHAHEQ